MGTLPSQMIGNSFDQKSRYRIVIQLWHPAGSALE